MKRYTVVVGNVGQVYEGADRSTARTTYREYVELSKANYGRVSQEPVTLFDRGEILAEYCGQENETL